MTAKKAAVTAVSSARPDPQTDDARAHRAAARPTAHKRPVGQVAFVGAGPGDPALLTERAATLLRQADVVAAPHAVLGRLLDAFVRQDAERIDLSASALPPADLARLLARHAKDGARVVRLFVGDPFVDGHAADHVAALTRHGVPFEVVPGLSMAVVASSYAGIPLAARGVGHVHLVDLTEPAPTWTSLSASRSTIVLLHAEPQLDAVATALVAAGLPADTPAAAVAGAATTAQHTVESTLAALAGDVAAEELPEPFVVVVGPNLALRAKLSWYETKPLFGWRVLVPRTKDQAGALSRELAGYGAVPEEVPTIAVEPPRNPQQLDRAITGMVTGRYEWVAFTSVNAVRAVREKFEEYGLDARAFAGLKIAAVGDKTAGSLRAWGIEPDLLPSGEQSARGLLADWPAYDSVLDPINRVFLPRADIATETLAAGLTELGWEADDVTAYRTVRAAPPPAPIREAIKTGRFDAVAFTSSSTVRNLVGIAGKPHVTSVIACIGPQTVKAAEEHGLRVDAVAETPSIEALARALAEFAAGRREELLAAGEPVTRPSERGPAARRRSS